ncbi:hypothetical protein PRBEI_2000605000 [Prionailurus iriomotensis]
MEGNLANHLEQTPSQGLSWPPRTSQSISGKHVELWDVVLATRVSPLSPPWEESGCLCPWATFPSVGGALVDVRITNALVGMRGDAVGNAYGQCDNLRRGATEAESFVDTLQPSFTTDQDFSGIMNADPAPPILISLPLPQDPTAQPRIHMAHGGDFGPPLGTGPEPGVLMATLLITDPL